MFNEEQFGAELDSKFEAYRQKALSTQVVGEAIQRKNLSEYDAAFQTRPEKCQNTDCHFPLANDNYRVLGVGDVCRLCYDMYHSVHDRAHFVECHRKWKAAVEESARKQKEREDNRDDAFDY